MSSTPQHTTFVVNAGHNGERTVTGADYYKTTEDGQFIDFVARGRGDQVLRLRAADVYSIELKQGDA